LFFLVFFLSSAFSIFATRRASLPDFCWPAARFLSASLIAASFCSAVSSTGFSSVFSSGFLASSVSSALPAFFFFFFLPSASPAALDSSGFVYSLEAG
jgi:hypothetical protein